MLLRINNLKEKQKGFTFVEFLVYTFLLSGILLAMGGITVNVLSSSSNSEVIEEVTYNVRFAMQKIGAEIRDADTIVLPGREGDMLWLRTNDERDPVLFWLEDGAIVMKVAGYPQETITASSTVIGSLTFKNVGLPKDPGSVQIQINASYYNPQNYPQYEFSDYFVSAYTLRAKNSKPSDKLLTDGLVGHWTFNEGKGLTAYDFSGNDNNGTLVGPPDWSENRFFEGDRALDFDGENDYVEISNVNPANGNSVSSWFYLNSVSDQDIYGDETSFKGMGFQIEAGTFYVIASDGSSANRWSIGLAPEAGKWYHVVQTFDTNSIKTYIDGELEHTKTGITLTQQNWLNFRLGKSSNGTYHNGYFNGLIDDVRIYNRALSPSEVKLLYENTKPY